MVTIHIDGKKYKVNEKDNLLKSCLSIGFNIPYFCWHPALGSIGACRQCAVKLHKNSEDACGSLVMSCMTPVTEGAFVFIEDIEAKQFRKSIIEWLMINHPHDCPICEEGGNCHLQDMTAMTGHSFRRYRFTKRTYHNQNLGPFISHEMNRCITCYRCVRYYKDYADGQDLGVYGAHDNIYFGRVEDGMLESEFSGNLVEICPTGVFTDKIHSKHYTRKWDMQFAPSICQQCSLGCNTILGERYGELRRVENRYNSSINHYFLCDRGRFGYGYVNLKNRPRSPVQRIGNKITTLNTEQAIQRAADILRKSKTIIGIGSPRASIESNFALRELVSAENFYTGINKYEQERLQLILKILREGGIYTPSLREIESYDAALVLGEDLTQTGARAALAIRQMVKGKAREIASAENIADWQISAILNIGQHERHPLFITNVDNTRLDDISTWAYRAPIEDQARFGFAIAHEIDNNSPAIKLDSDLQDKVNMIAQVLMSAKKPLIISGTNAGSTELIKAAANIAKALKERDVNVGITMIARTVNSIGLSMIGGESLEEALIKLESGFVDAVLILENDLYYYSSEKRINAALSKIPFVIVIDHQRTMIMDKAHLVLSAANFAESDGTVINNEGRAQRFFKVYEPTYYNSSISILESWRWLYSLHSAIKYQKIDRMQFDRVIDAIVRKIPQLAGIKNVAPEASFRIYGQKLARQPHRYSGRTAMLANISVHEPRQPQDQDTMFTFSMEGNNQPSALHSQVPFIWTPGWNSPQAWNKFQSEIDNHFYHKDSGMRLIEVSKTSLNFFTEVPESFRPQKKAWRIVPYYHLFCSDELSRNSPAFQSCILPSYIKFNPADAVKLGFKSGTTISFSYEDHTIVLSVIFSENLSEGEVGLPIGISGITPALEGMRIDNFQEIQT